MHAKYRRLLVTGKIRLPKVEHPKIKGHVMLNEDEYQTSVQLKFRYCLGVSEFTVSFLIACILVEEIDFEIRHFLITFGLNLYLNLRTGHT